MPEQLTFDLPAIPALGRDAFFVSPSNALAVRQIDAWSDWPDRRLVLCGPGGSGKTHLAHVWAALSGATILTAEALSSQTADGMDGQACLVVENAENVTGDPGREAALFHIYNLLQANGGSLLLTARQAPARWHIRLPDLRSRLQSVGVVTLESPDDSLLAALLVKLFADRQIKVAPEMISYVVSRMDRSAAAARDLVAALDQAGLQSKRPLTRSLAARVLDESHQDRA